MKLALALALVLAATACGDTAPGELPPEGQILLYFTTDAPLPAAPGKTLAPGDPPALFDRLRVEILAPGMDVPCTDCTHEFALDRDLVATARASIGIVPRPGVAGYRARVRMFEAAHVEEGQPRPDGTVDVTAALPIAGREGVVEATVMLHTDRVARPDGSLTAPVPIALGRPPPGVVGSWPPAQRTPCRTPRDDGTVCIPGGAFWMGNPITRALRSPGDIFVLRLVSLAPFRLDPTEVTVAAFRDQASAMPGDPLRYNANDGMPGPVIHCTYTDRVGNQEALPVNCLSVERARAHCEARGGSLPTEAQMEYVTGALESRPYVWGTDPPTCEDAVYGRNVFGGDATFACPGRWLQPPGSGKRDRLAIAGSAEVVDLAGNLIEYVADRWAIGTDACWGTGVLHDPLCTSDTTDRINAGAFTMVGGGFLDGAAATPAGTRRPTFDYAASARRGPGGGVDAPLLTTVGFRCAHHD